MVWNLPEGVFNTFCCFMQFLTLRCLIFPLYFSISLTWSCNIFPHSTSVVTLFVHWVDMVCCWLIISAGWHHWHFNGTITPFPSWFRSFCLPLSSFLVHLSISLFDVLPPSSQGTKSNRHFDRRRKNPSLPKPHMTLHSTVIRADACYVWASVCSWNRL